MWVCESVIHWDLRTENLVSKHLTAKEPKRALYFCLSRAIPTQTCPIWQITSDFVSCVTWMSRNFGRINCKEIKIITLIARRKKKWETKKMRGLKKSIETNAQSESENRNPFFNQRCSWFKWNQLNWSQISQRFTFPNQSACNRVAHMPSPVLLSTELPSVLCATVVNIIIFIAIVNYIDD